MKKRKNKKSLAKIKAEMFDKYAKSFQEEMDKTFKKADMY